MAEGSKSSSANLMPTFLGVAVVMLIVAVILIIGLARRPSGGLSLPPGYDVVHVSEYSYGFRLASTTLPAGNIVFVDKNTATIPHEFRALQDGPPGRQPAAEARRNC